MTTTGLVCLVCFLDVFKHYFKITFPLNSPLETNKQTNLSLINLNIAQERNNLVVLEFVHKKMQGPFTTNFKKRAIKEVLEKEWHSSRQLHENLRSILKTAMKPIHMFSTLFCS